jgi:hypothetical protein
MNKPRYFIAVFGAVEKGSKEGVEAGGYFPNPKFPPSAMQMTIGDVLLLYCTANYPGYKMEAPGLGVVLSTASDRVNYRWVPLVQPIARESIKASLGSHEAERFGQLQFGHNWLIEISSESFSNIMRGRSVSWAKL